MSRNFELMQKAGDSFRPALAPEMPPPVSATNVVEDGGYHETYKPMVPINAENLGNEESVRLVQRIFLAPGAKAPRVVMFAGIDPGNGCTQICSRTAEILASNTTGSVCLVDANLRTPAVPEYFGVTNHFGLSDSLRQPGSIRSFAKRLRPDNLWLLTCGSLNGDTAILINSEVMRSRVAELRSEFDYVLIDSPALNSYADAAAIGKLADGLVLIIEANATRKEAAVRVADNLRASSVNVLGAVLNKRTFPIPESLYRIL